MGGSSHSLLNLIHSLKGEVKPIIIVPQEGSACQEFRKRGIKYYVIPFHLSITNEKGIRRLLEFVPRIIKDWIVNSIAVRKIAQISKAENIQLVHTNSVVIDFGQGVAESLGVPHVWHLREFLDLDFDLSPVIGWRLFLKKIHQSNAVIGISKAVYKHYQLHSHPTAYVIPNAVRSRNHSIRGQGKKCFLLFCGYVTPQKGVEDALHALAIVANKNYDLRLLIVGRCDQGYLAKLRRLIQELGIENLVDFLGYQQSIDSYVQEALALVMCSRNEALGRVTIEAMFNGCPVIGYRSAGTMEIINDGRTGYLYNTVHELADQVIHLLNHQSHVADVVNNARAFANANYSEEDYAGKLLTLYEQLLRG